MATSTDPRVLVALSRCFDTCIPPGDQLAVKTYLLAQIAGITDPKVVLTNARCFNSCISQGAQLFVQAFLGAILSGQSQDPSTIANDARCFASCIPFGALPAVINYNLALKAGGSMDPSTLANAARCFSSCIPNDFQTAAQTYLMAVASGQSTNPSILIQNPKVATLIGTLPPALPLMILGDAIAVWQSSFSVIAPTGFSFAVRADASVIDVSWDAPPSGVVKTELWTSNDGITFALEATIAAPGTATTSTIPAAGFTKYGEIRWCNASVCGPFTAVQSVSSGAVAAMVWSNEVVANGGPVPSVSTRNCAANFLDAISSIRSRIYHLNIVGDGTSFNQFASPLIHTNGVTPWVRQVVGAGQGESLTIAGYKGAQSGVNGNSWDTGVVPSGVASFNAANCGISVYMSDAVITAGPNAAAGSFDLANVTLQIRPNQTGGQTAAFGWDAANPTTAAAPTFGGFYMCSRTATNNLQVYFSNSTHAWSSLQTIAVVNAQTPNVQKIAFCGCLNGATYFCAGLVTISFMAIHDGFNSADGKILADAVQALRVCLGGGFV